MIRMLESFDDPSYGPVLQSTMRSLSTTQEGNESVDSLFQQINSRYHDANLCNVLLIDI